MLNEQKVSLKEQSKSTGVIREYPSYQVGLMSCARSVRMSCIVGCEFIGQLDGVDVLQTIKCCSQLCDLALVEMVFSQLILLMSQILWNLCKRRNPVLGLGRRRESDNAANETNGGEYMCLHFLQNVRSVARRGRSVQSEAN